MFICSLFLATNGPFSWLQTSKKNNNNKGLCILMYN